MRSSEQMAAVLEDYLIERDWIVIRDRDLLVVHRIRDNAFARVYVGPNMWTVRGAPGIGRQAVYSALREGFPSQNVVMRQRLDAS